MLSELIKIKGSFIKAVNILKDFYDEELNQYKLDSYYVNPSAREALYSISKGLHPTSKERVHLISGTYGSGKSHFALVTANYLTKNSDSKDLEMIFRRTREKDPGKATEIYRVRNINKPYFLILLEGYDPDGAEHALLKGLKDHLKRENLPEEIFKTSFQSALNKIEEWENNKPEFFKEMKEILIEEGQDIGTIKDELREGFREAPYRLFKKIHLKITTSPFEPIYYEKVSQIYSQISELLINEHQYKGVVIIWDQFDEHIRSTRHTDLGREEGCLRNLVEIIERSGENQLHLILISHHLPHEYLRGEISEEALHNWERIEGRFHQHLLEAIKESEELIDYAITQQKENEGWNEVERCIERSTRMIDMIIELGLFQKDKDWVMDTICKGTFPLHPISTYCLPRISDVVGQAERTMFTFFEEENKEGGFTKFINENCPIQQGKLNFYTAEKLFDFFKQAIESNSFTHHVVKNYSEAISKIKDPEEILTQQVMKAIAVINTIKTKHSAIPLLATLSNLSLLLNIEENRLKPLLASLFESKALWIRTNGEYDFGTGQTIVNFEEDFAKIKEGLRWDNPIYELNSLYTPGDIIARGYERDYWVTRKLHTEYIDATSLDNIRDWESKIKNEYKDAFALYVITESEGEINEAKRKAVNIKNPQVVIVVPKKPLRIFSPLKNVKVLEKLKKQKTSYDIEDTEAYHMWKDRYDSEKKKLNDEILKWKDIETLFCFSNGETLSTTGKKDTDIADYIMYRVFDKTPIVKHRRMANREEQDQKNDRIKLTTAILDVKKEEIECLAKGRAPAEKTILEHTFDPQGMLEIRSQGNSDYYRFREPKDDKMIEVWEMMKNNLLRSGPCSDFKNLVIKLQLPPYGLSTRVIELFLSAFFRLHPNRFTIKTKKTKYSPWESQEFIGDTIYEIVNNPDLERVIVEYRDKFPLEDEYLLTINIIVSPEKEYLGKLPLIDGVGKLFIEWFKSLPPITMSAIDLGPQSRSFLQTIAESTRDMDKMDKRELLFEIIPSAVGIEKKLDIWDKSDLEKFDSHFKNIVDELNNYPDEVLKKAINCFKIIFNVKGDTAVDVMEKVKNWYNELDPAVKEHKFTGYAQKILNFANIQRVDQFKDKFLVELPKQLGFNEFKQWENLEQTLENYRKKIAEAKIEVEKYHKSVVRPAEVKKLSKKAELLKDSLKQKIQHAHLDKKEILMLLEELIEEYRK